MPRFGRSGGDQAATKTSYSRARSLDREDGRGVRPSLSWRIEKDSGSNAAANKHPSPKSR
jgi:hypothetical protein